jgi:hypothetical protein
VDIASISSAVAGFRAAFDIAKGAITARDEAKLESAEREMGKQMLDLLQTAITLETERHAAIRRCTELEDENRKLKGLADDMAQYELHQTRGGGIVRRPQEGVHNANMAVYLCANCANAGKKTYLQPKHGGIHLECPDGHPDVPGDRLVENTYASARSDYDPFDGL